MSVNVSMRQLETEDFMDQVRGRPAVTALEPKSLIIEITETGLMQETESTICAFTSSRS